VLEGPPNEPVNLTLNLWSSGCGLKGLEVSHVIVEDLSQLGLYGTHSIIIIYGFRKRLRIIQNLSKNCGPRVGLGGGG